MASGCSSRRSAGCRLPLDRDILGPERLSEAVVVSPTAPPSAEALAEGILRPVFEAIAALIAAGVSVDVTALQVAMGTPWADATPQGPTLSFPAHASPVALPPRPTAPVSSEPPVRGSLRAQPQPLRRHRHDHVPRPGPAAGDGGRWWPNRRTHRRRPSPPRRPNPPLRTAADGRRFRPVAGLLPGRSAGSGRSDGHPVAAAHAENLQWVGHAHQAYLAHQSSAFQRFMQVHQRARTAVPLPGRDPSHIGTGRRAADLRGRRSGSTGSVGSRGTGRDAGRGTGSDPRPRPHQAPKPAPVVVPASPPVAPAQGSRFARRGCERHPSGHPAQAATPTEFVGLTLSREQLKIHASGNISEIYGDEFKGQDGYAIQCRMPEPPLLLADRVVGLEPSP